MEHHVEVPEQSEQVAPEEVGVGPGRRLLAGICRPFTAVGRRLIRFLFDRQVMADAVDRRLGVGERFDEMSRSLAITRSGLEQFTLSVESVTEGLGRLTTDTNGQVASLAADLEQFTLSVESVTEGLGRLTTDTNGQVASLAADLEQISSVISVLAASLEGVEQQVADKAGSDQVESALEGISELQTAYTDERGRLESLSADLAKVAATVAARTRTVAPEAPLTVKAKAWIESVSSVWPAAALEAYARARQTLELDFGRDPELPAPPETVAKLLASVCLDGGSPDDIGAYLYDSYWRFLHTLELVGSEQERTLELGANPYFTTVLLWEYQNLELELELANYFGLEDTEVGTQVVEYVDAEGVQKKRTVEFRHFNIEFDRFPYEDGSFGLVLFCEVLEHLVEDPVAVLTEINRVTEVGGHLVLTTPNVARAENVARLLNGDNLYDPYSGFGPYGRHNREYTLDELRQLLAFTGFDVECGYSADGHPWSPDVNRLEVIRPELDARVGDLGHYLFVRAVKTGSPREGRPEFLYRSLADEELAPTGVAASCGPST
jgi:SAM-dependent methyltransferase